MCLMPISAARQEHGAPKFDPEGELKLPCGKCTECIKKRSIDWATRARHEMSCHKENCFLTLTYNPESLPSDFIVKKDFQKFIENLRYHHDVRYMVSYEYGTKNFRPHMHAILFGYSPDDQKFYKNSKSGEMLFTSKFIDNLWNKGFHSIGTANEKTAYYIASYALKGKKHEITHPNTGEIETVTDTMDVSKRPGIGLEYFKRNYKQLVDTRSPLPRYYQKKLEEIDLDYFQKFQDQQTSDLKTRSSHEVYAKFCIDQQKLDQSDSEYRKIDIDEKITHNQKYLLQYNRDAFHALEQEE